MNKQETPVTNPALKQAMKCLHAGQNGRESQMAALELLLRAQLIAPVAIVPGGKDGKDAQIQFQLVTTPDDRAFFPAFTDLDEMKKHFADPEQKTLVLTFADYAGMILRDKAAAGLVVDPFGDSLTLETGLVEFLDKVWKEEQKQSE